MILFFKKLFLTVAVIFTATVFVSAQNQLFIPPVLTGTTFNLNVQTGTQTFYIGTTTPTYGINGAWMSPTLIVNKGDSITLNVINNLPVATTMHWHGLHVAAMNDGGPHQIINASTTWSPTFKVRNNAATFWYHPHGEGKTEQQVSKGLAGLFIVKDAAEALINLPRTYGADDFPIIVQSKSFDVLQQIAIATDMDTALFVNGTLNPFLNVPEQVVRFRLLNGSSLRSYNFGLSNGQNFYQIATDGGLLDSSISLSRLKLSPGERVEILIDFSGMLSQSIFLQSFGSELPTGIYGADTVGMGMDSIHEYEENYLNGIDFNLLQLNIVAAIANPVTTIASSLIPYNPINSSSATNFRTIVMDTLRLLPMDQPNLAEGPFGMNNQTFHMDSINEIVYLNTTEVWTLKNKTLIAHPFHIHDIQFNILEKSGLPPSPSENGWKDVVLVMPGDSVKFITKFETFADNITPYMYHCHLLHHEDDGMMGSFLVIDTFNISTTEITQSTSVKIYPNPSGINVTVEAMQLYGSTITINNILGKEIFRVMAASSSQKINVRNFADGIYFLKVMNNNNQATIKKFIVSKN